MEELWRKIMEKRIASFLGLGLFLCFFVTILFIQNTSAATPPQIITYQGKLLDNGLSATTTKDISFVLYDDPIVSTPLYTASGTVGTPLTLAITPNSGIFSIDLGSGETNSLSPEIFKNYDSVYLEVTVNGETLTPRRQITAIPYAFNAKYLDGVSASSTSPGSTHIVQTDVGGDVELNNVTTTELKVTGNAGFAGNLNVFTGLTYFTSGTAFLTSTITLGESWFLGGVSTTALTVNGALTGVDSTDLGDYADLVRIIANNTFTGLNNFLATSTFATTTIASSTITNANINNLVVGNNFTANNVQYNWTGSQGGVNTYLKNDGSGNLSWGAIVGGGTIDGSGVANNLAFWSDSDTLTSSSSLYWNNTTGRLGVGTSTPGSSLDVVGDVNFSGSLKHNNGVVVNFSDDGGLALGTNVGSYLYYNTLVGYGAGQFMTGGQNTAIGRSAGSQETGTQNTFLGDYAGYFNVSGHRNTFVGYNVGLQSTGSDNVFLGYKAGYNETGSNKLYIENSDSVNPLVYGEFDNDLLRVNGDFWVSSTLSVDDATGNVSTSGTIQSYIPASTGGANDYAQKWYDNSGDLIASLSTTTQTYVLPAGSSYPIADFTSLEIGSALHSGLINIIGDGALSFSHTPTNLEAVLSRTGLVLSDPSNNGVTSTYAYNSFALKVSDLNPEGIFNVNDVGNVSTSGTLRVFSTSSLNSIKLSSLVEAPDTTAGNLYFNSNDGKFYGYTANGVAVELGATGSGSTNWSYDTNYGSSVLTPSSTIPVWFKDNIYASGTLQIGTGGAVISSSVADGMNFYFGTGPTSAGINIDDANVNILYKELRVSSDIRLGSFVGDWYLGDNNQTSGTMLIRSASGVPYYSFTQDNKFGIGTTTPSYNLHVLGTAGITGSISASGTLQIFSTSTLASVLPGTNLTYDLGDSTNRWNNLWAGTVNIGTSTWSLSQDASNNLNIREHNASVSAMVIDSAGKIGVGTDSPAYQFDVAGSMRVSGQATFSGGLQTAGSLSSNVDLDGVNLYTNPSAEDPSIENWAVVPFEGDVAGESYAADITTDYNYHGARAVRLYVDTGNTSKILINDVGETRTLSLGLPYTYSIYGKTLSATSTSHLVLQMAVSQEEKYYYNFTEHTWDLLANFTVPSVMQANSQYLQPLDLNSNFQRFSYTFVPSVGTYFSAFLIAGGYTNDDAGKTAIFDAIQLEQSATVSAFDSTDRTAFNFNSSRNYNSWTINKKLLSVSSDSGTLEYFSVRGNGLVTIGNSSAVGAMQFYGSATNTITFGQTALFTNNLADAVSSSAFVFNATNFSNVTNEYLLSLRTAGTPKFSVSANGDVNAAGTIFAQSATVGTPGTPGDLAEKVDIAADDIVEPGDVMMVDSSFADTYRKTYGAYEQAVAGVISTNPTIVFGNGKTQYTAILAMVGRIPVKVSNENGQIKQGDLLVSASLPGYAMKYDSTKDDGKKIVGIVGVALESLDSDSTGKIMALIRTGWANNNFNTIDNLQNRIQELLLNQGVNINNDLNVENQNGDINYVGGNLNLRGNLILNASSINDSNNSWYIDSEGYFVTRLETSEGTKEMYGLQSPQAEFVFSSSSQLINGEAEIIFVTSEQEIIDSNSPIKVTVTLTSGEAAGIYVAEKSLIGFKVKELQSGTSNATFDWIVVAKRRSGDFVDTNNAEVVVEETTTTIEVVEDTSSTTPDISSTLDIVPEPVVDVITLVEEPAPTPIVETLPEDVPLIIETPAPEPAQ